MVERVSERDNLIGQAKIEEEIPLIQEQQPLGQVGRNSTFKEQNLLIVDKKKKFVPAKDTIDQGEGVLSIPQEDPPNNCKKCCWCLCCLPYYLLCCCCCWKEKEFAANKPDFIKRFTKWLPNSDKDTDETADKDPIPVLIQLYSCEPSAITELATCRINPNLTSPVRTDIEFYIPQLISFYLQGIYPKMDQFIDFVVQACEQDFYFSHRIFFQLKSVTFESITDLRKEDQQRGAVDSMLKAIYKMISSSTSDEQDQQKEPANDTYVERVFLPNSRDLVRLLVTFNMVQFYPQLKECRYAGALMQTVGQGYPQVLQQFKDQNARSASGTKLERKITQWQQQRLRNVQMVINEYNDKGWNQQATLRQMNHAINDDVSEDSQNNLRASMIDRMKQDYQTPSISARDIFLPPFKDGLTAEQATQQRNKEIDLVVEEETKPTLAQTPMELRASQRIYDSYLSTPNFIKKLCEISDGLIDLTDKRPFLMRELESVNRQLPAAVYIPFVNQSMRNYAVLHIVAEESRIFKTKERCPLLLCIEVYRPTEVALEPVPDAINIQREIQEQSKPKAVQFEIQASSEIVAEEDPFKKTRVNKKGHRSVTMTQSLRENPYPFGVVEEDSMSAFGGQKDKAMRNSISVHSSRNSISDSSFISATDDPSAMQRQKLEEKMRIKKQKQAEKRFTKLKNLKNPQQISKEFGELADMRASQPNLLIGALNKHRGEESKLQRRETLKNIDSNYFNKHFAATPKVQSNENNGNLIVPNEFKALTREQSGSFRRNTNPPTSRPRSRSNEIKGPISVPQIEEETKQPEIQLITDEEEAYMAKASGMGQTKGLSFVSNEEEQKSPKVTGKPEASKLIPQSPTPTEGQNIDFFTDRDYYKIFLETSKEQEARIKKNSPFQGLKTWKLLRLIIKTNDDLRQEAFAMQLISQCDQIFRKAKLPLWLKPYEIIATGPRCGLIEVVSDALSVSSIKEKTGGPNPTIVDYFHSQFGKTGSKKYQTAVENFTNSLCAYSLVCYILQIKDRHNENILIDIEGHVLHIDFGFLLSNAPGKGIKFETAPFKLTQEMLDVMGGMESNTFRDFRTRMARGFCALQANAEKVIILVEMMLMGQNDLPCFQGSKTLIRDLKYRLFPNGRRMQFEEALRHINDLISQSVNNWRTRCYDRAQYCMQGIL